jgi:hypothetical protein
MNEDYMDDFFWSAVQVGDKFYVVTNYYLVSGAKYELGKVYATVWDALAEADRRNPK